MNVVDLHCDTIAKLYAALHDQSYLANPSVPGAAGAGNPTPSGAVPSLRQNTFHIDLRKMKRGDYLLQNFAVFLDAPASSDPHADALAMIDLYKKELSKNEDLILPALSYEEIERNRRLGKMSALLTLEEGTVVRGSLAALRDFYRSGVRMIALTWNYENEIGAPNLTFDTDGMPLFSQRNDRGLTPFGFEMICEMERLGMIVDTSHLSDGGFWDVAHTIQGPFVASHSNAATCCNVCRNLTDDMIRELAAHGGVMGLNFCSDFLTPPEARNVSPQNAVQKVSKIRDMVRHIRHITNVGGIGVCALGSDMDGISDTLEFTDASGIGQLADALSLDGFSTGDIENIFSGNVLRVYRDVF